jgi:hypothetical protein
MSENLSRNPEQVEDSADYMQRELRIEQRNQAVDLKAKEDPEAYEVYLNAPFRNQVVLSDIWLEEYQREGKL